MAGVVGILLGGGKGGGEGEGDRVAVRVRVRIQLQGEGEGKGRAAVRAGRREYTRGTRMTWVGGWAQGPEPR